MFQLNKNEWRELVPNWHQFEKVKHTSSLTYVFTEQGVAMLSSVLRSDKAIDVNIVIMRAFVELKKFIINNQEVLQKITDLETDVKLKFFEQDKQISLIF